MFYLGTANITVSAANYSNPDISGVVVRFKWDNLEQTPNNFDWTFIDNEIANAITYHKKVSLQPLGVPHWLDSIGAKQYYYIDKNSAHSTYGQVVYNVIPWDSIYVIRYKNLLQHLSLKYSNNSTVSYINAIGVAFSRGLPDTVLTDTTLLIQQAFWTTYNYNADTLGHLMNQITDYYMSLFPSTPLWCSVDYVLFQPSATGQPRNYLASIYCNYGIANYPDRFGLFREDISACNPPSNISSGSQWYIMQQNYCQTGAQMLWSVQDGPTRMNQCGILPNAKTVVLDSAVNKALSFGMRYLEIYGADISDTSLAITIQNTNNKLVSEGLQCNPTSVLTSNKSEINFSIYPNPADQILNILFKDNKNANQQIEIYDSMGRLSKELTLSESTQINISNLRSGLYFIYFKGKNQFNQKFFKQ